MAEIIVNVMSKIGRNDDDMMKKKQKAVPINSASVVKPKPKPGLFGSFDTIMQSVIEVVMLKSKRPMQHKIILLL